MSGDLENERSGLVALADSLKWVDSTEEPQNVIMALLREVNSCRDSRQSVLSITSLSERLGCSASLVRRSIYSLLRIRQTVCISQADWKELSDSLQKLGLSVPLCDAIVEYIESIQERPTFEISMARPSQYPPLVSSSARTEINIGTMALRYSPGVLVRFCFVIGDTEKIILFDAATLQRCCQQIQNALSSALKLCLIAKK
ncbi:hypothetical protein Tcan_04022 [Toxocara canis]|uniref:Uncharacterized protein n=1 Tax=Toxocara canis TaxID=6265 RepID=A0A0B2V0Y5_TOXCA|nr:hypothetical protein Tcan_04022 [Toxocara canis]